MLAYKYLAVCQNETEFNNFPNNVQYLSFKKYSKDIIEKQNGTEYYINYFFR